uniref:SPX domain-containing protein n=2 Tax=Rhodosorus marinus TaxID=101924 RepID=A0A7S2ZQ99_9RHOD|mmetsp:Transcript_27435/g.107365  ORF Transcript_27435/g.107365 Transcript_27435/m.107365 type:complete len:669 (+) Transcript_27435:269-2275(+)
MKFSKQLLYNAVAEWRQYYMDYGGLKKIISKFKKIQVAQQEGDESDSDNAKPKTDDEALPLLASSVRSPVLNRTASAQVLLDLEEANLDTRVSSRMYGATTDDFSDAIEKIETTFFNQLEINAQRVEGFYVRMEKELERISNALVRHATSGSKKDGEDRTLFYTSLRRRYVEHYLEIAEVLNFAELNKTGFEKIMKKHDKVTNLHCKDDKMRELSGKYSFTHPGKLEAMKKSVEEEFARCFWSGDVDHAKEELRESLRELVIWERNTIWRDMLQSERRVNAVVAKKAGQGIKRYWMPSLKPVPVFVSVIMFLIVLLASPALFDLLPNISHYHPANVYAAQRSLSLVVLVSFLWATEAVPLYVTALAVPALSVILNVYVTENGKRLMLSGDAAKLAVSAMCSSTILLIIGGYSIASALSKYALDKTVAMYVLAKAGQPSQVLLLLMLLAVFLSMWISNVATPVLLNSIMLPIVQGFSAHSLPFVKCLLLGIALASNIGGMGTPIASPQNAIALSALEGMQQVSFLQWTAISVPLMLLMVILGHGLLMFWFRPGKFALPIIPSHVEAFTAPHYLILGTVAVTISLWCWKPAVAIAGSEGIIACLPILVFYGSGLLSKEDFNNLPWNVIMLVAGGVSLGSAVEASKLLRIVGGAISQSMSGASLWMVGFRG